jgi:X-X-X-Leu-X-X-Gly heptad repeat protein
LSSGLGKFGKGFDRLASGFDKLDNGFDRLSNGLDKFAKGFDRFASGFLSIFNTGLVRFLIELFCEKPVISEALVLALYSNAKTELEIMYVTNKHESMPVNINHPEFICNLP